jgi:Ca2+-binding EF-hand superfamily protein
MNNAPRLLNKNIPLLQATQKMGRQELYTFYIMFKALTVVSSQIIKPDGGFNTQGVEYSVWRRGIFQLSMMSDDMAKRVYMKIDDSMEGTLDWEEFLKGMQIINAKTKMQMIELFINLADIHRTGQLDFKEMCELSAFSLKRYFSTKDQQFFSSLVEYFARFIFQACDTPLDQKLNLKAIVDLIEQVGSIDGRDIPTLLL